MIRFSDAAAALLAGDGGLRRALSGAHMVFYTGTQPASANATPGTSQPIISFTKDDGVFVAETRPQWEIVFSGITGTAGLSSLKIDNWEILGATVTADSLADVADDVATQINANLANVDFRASSDGVDTVTITGPKGVGAAMNSCVIAGTESGTITCTETGAGAVSVSGVNSSNALAFDVPANGTGLTPAEEVFYIAKPSGATWKGKNGFGPATAAATAVFTGIVDGNTYTAGWGRICASAGDDGSTATSGEDGYVRVDFSIGTSGTDFIMSPAATFTVNTTSGDEIETLINTLRLKINKKMA